MSLIGLLVALVFVAVVVWAAKRLLAAYHVEEPIRTTLYVLIVVVCALIVLQQLGYVGGPYVRLR